MLRLVLALAVAAAAAFALAGPFGGIRLPASFIGMPTPMLLFIALAAFVLLVLARAGSSRRL